VAHLILYDGVCGLCDRWVQLVLARDRADQFRFATLQGTLGSDRVRRYGRDTRDLDTVYVVTDYGQPAEALLWRGAAALFVLRRLGGLWSVVGRLGALFPVRIADRVYDFIARRRYRWFGRFDSCRVPAAGERAKFLDVDTSPAGGAARPA
jgi:predicted DCC family thiol-disulfide oxidoreductase YuxK